MKKNKYKFGKWKLWREYYFFVNYRVNIVFSVSFII